MKRVVLAKGRVIHKLDTKTMKRFIARRAKRWLLCDQCGFHMEAAYLAGFKAGIKD
jgi:hypothetical protein